MEHNGTHHKPVIVHIKSLVPACGNFIEPEKSNLMRDPGVSVEASIATTDPLY